MVPFRGIRFAFCRFVWIGGAFSCSTLQASPGFFQFRSPSNPGAFMSAWTVLCEVIIIGTYQTFCILRRDRLRASLHVFILGFFFVGERPMYISRVKSSKSLSVIREYKWVACKDKRNAGYRMMTHDIMNIAQRQLLIIKHTLYTGTEKSYQIEKCATSDQISRYLTSCRRRYKWSR